MFTYKPVGRQRIRKYYAIDVAFISNHEYSFGSTRYGWRLENVVALELMRRMNPESDQLYYLNKHKAYEVDFVVVRSGRIDELIQVSYDFSNPSQKLYKREIGGLLKGSESVKCDNLTLIIMEGTPEVKTVEGKRIKIVKASDWLLGCE